MKQKNTGPVLVFFAAVLMSLGGILIKTIPWGAMAINSGRNLFAALVTFAYMRATGYKLRLNKTVLGCALAEGEAAPRWAAEADRLARRMDGQGRLVIKPPALESYIAAAGGALAGAMLTAKFVQGLPIVGVAGGAANLAVYRQVLERARLKYQLRWLEKRAEAAGDQEQDRVEGKERWSF